jgi:mgtE-like transporter
MNLSLTVTLPIFASFIVFIVHFFNGGNTSYFKFLFIALVAAVMSGFFQILLTLSISFFVFKKGLDPDVVVYPIISVIADIITSFAIFTALSIELTLWPAIANDIFESFGELFALFYFCLFVLITFSTPIRSRSNLDFELFNLLKESIPIIMISILIGSIVGIILDKGITHEGIVLILPIFMSYTGAVGSIIGSKFTTSYHLGSLSMRNGKLEMYVYLPIILLIVGSALSSILGIVAFSISQSLNFSLPNTVTMFSYILVCVLISIITTMFSIINALFLGNLTFRRGIDADNVIVPLSTTLGDLIAIITVLIVTNVIFY